MIPAPEYPKTENLLLRDETTHKLILDAYRSPSYGQVARWHVTEKIDGTNIRLIVRRTDGDLNYEVRGRSDNATLPKNFVQEAIPDLTADLMDAALASIDPGYRSSGMVVYGEGYGPGIQKCGGAYTRKKSLRIFDIQTLKEGAYSLWRPWADVQAVADVIGVQTAPTISTTMTTEECLLYVGSRPSSIVAGIEGSDEDVLVMEGVVARTDPYLYDSRGGRVRFKLKGHDLP